jgi:hypothetical protein
VAKARKLLYYCIPSVETDGNTHKKRPQKLPYQVETDGNTHKKRPQKLPYQVETDGNICRKGLEGYHTRLKPTAIPIRKGPKSYPYQVETDGNTH